jgi:DNA-binding transcriptional ArsR family regulator
MPRIAVEMAELGSLVGDVSRAKILATLMDGRASTALELSLAARVTPQTTSSHLAKLLAANLLAVEKQGRHRYYRLASQQVAQALETIMALTAHGPPRHRAKSKIDDELRVARMCYDHVAGLIGVGISDALIGHGHVIFEGDAGEVTESGQKFFTNLGIDLMAPMKGRRIFCRPCLDWSERRPHLAGHVGAQIASFCLERNWLARKKGSRALTLARPGMKMLRRSFGMDIGKFSL